MIIFLLREPSTCKESIGKKKMNGLVSLGSDDAPQRTTSTKTTQIEMSSKEETDSAEDATFKGFGLGPSLLHSRGFDSFPSVPLGYASKVGWGMRKSLTGEERNSVQATDWRYLRTLHLGDHVFGERYGFIPAKEFINLLPNLESVHFSSYEERLKSFGRYWPKQMAQIPEELAAAGFYYVGPGDKVNAFCCGVSIFQWNHYDNAWYEHRKHSPSCNLPKIVSAKIGEKELYKN
jgi:hypothetical protein